MKETVTTWFRVKNEPRHELGVDLEKLHEEMDALYKQFVAHEDGIRDYYRFFKNQDHLWSVFNLDHKMSPEFHVGKIEIEKECIPFEKRSWGEYLNVRNSIVHRGKIEATQSVALNSVGCLYSILYHLGFYGMRLSIESNIFRGFGQPRNQNYPYNIFY